MTITISAFSAVLLILVLHTIITHLLNWLFRQWDSFEPVFMAICLGVVEFLIVTIILKNIL